MTGLSRVVRIARGGRIAGLALATLALPLSPPVVASETCEGWIGEKVVEAWPNATPEFVRQCVADGADPNIRDGTGWTPLHWAAVFAPSGDVIDALVDSGANPNALNDLGQCPLHMAVLLLDNQENAAALVDAGADPNHCGGAGGSLLLDVAWFDGNPAWIRFLLDAGADPLVRDEHGRTALHRIPALLPLAIRALVDAGIDPNVRNEFGYAPLHLAVAPFAPVSESVQALLDLGADPLARDMEGWTPLHWAAHAAPSGDYGSGPEESGGNLIDAIFGPVEGRTERMERALVEVVIPELVDAGADPNARNGDGWTPLHLAALNSSPAVVRALLDAGGDATAKTDEGHSAADLARENELVRDHDVYGRLEDALSGSE